MRRVFFLLPLFLLPFSSTIASAQYYGALSTTWNNPISASASMMIQGAINRKMLEQSIANQQRGRMGSTSPATIPAPAAPKQPSAPPPNYAALRFKPVSNSGVARQIADTVGKDPKERAALLSVFEEIKRSYESEAAKAGRSNDVAAALTFFLVAGSMTYHQTDEPADSVTDALVEVLQQEMSASEDFKRMSNSEKQRMHDWLVVTGGFLLAGYLDAVKTDDKKELGDYKELADAMFKIVLGTGAKDFNLAAIK